MLGEIVMTFLPSVTFAAAAVILVGTVRWTQRPKTRRGAHRKPKAPTFRRGVASMKTG